MTCTTLDKGSFRVLSLHKNLKAYGNAKQNHLRMPPKK